MRLFTRLACTPLTSPTNGDFAVTLNVGIVAPNGRPMQKQTDQHLNLLGDCVILGIASAAATKLPWHPGWHWVVFLGISAGSIFLWSLGGRGLRHYDVWNG